MKTIFSLNQDCENALIDFPFHDIAATWIEEQKSLFETIEKIRNSELYKSSHLAEIVFIDIFFDTYTSNE
jgi:hypothetical protein